MVFTDVEAFLETANARSLPTRDEEKVLAARMADGDLLARDALVRRYYPMVAAHIRRAPSDVRTLHTVYACLATLEKGVDQFSFLQDSESFAHHLGWRLRQCIVRCIAERS